MNDIEYLIDYLKKEYENPPVEFNGLPLEMQLRCLMNIRCAKPLDKDFLAVQDRVLHKLTSEKGITDITNLAPVSDGIYLWQGDITTLKCGAIVNAANSAMTGCYYPCHNCIDNAIHFFAGAELRYECSELMKKQGYPEPTGKAKITSAYNLPCDYIIHTVGPIVRGELTERHCTELESCYKSCLEEACKNNISSIAFCCISTGVFGFPNDKAAEIAVQSVKRFHSSNNIEVIFNVFKDIDFKLYKQLFM